MAARRRLTIPTAFAAILSLALILTGCAVTRSPEVARIALLGPFEGRYREVGYNALYAARLALRDAGGPHPTLMAVDDGGSLAGAVQRAKALALDPLVQVVIAVGYHAADPTTQAALRDLPVLIPGGWTTIRARQIVFLLSDPSLPQSFTVPATIDVVDAAAQARPVVGGDVLALAQFPRLRESLDGVTLLTSGQPPSLEFAARYADGQPFAPEPNILAMLVYDATTLAADAVSRSAGAVSPRVAVSQALAAAEYEGLSGHIAFEDGVWRDAPRHAFRFDAYGRLVAVDDLIEQR